MFSVIDVPPFRPSTEGPGSRSGFHPGLPFSFFFFLIETLSITSKKFPKCVKNCIDRLRKGTTAAPHNESEIAAITVFLTVRQGRISLTSIVIYELHLPC